MPRSAIIFSPATCWRVYTPPWSNWRAKLAFILRDGSSSSLHLLTRSGELLGYLCSHPPHISVYLLCKTAVASPRAKPSTTSISSASAVLKATIDWRLDFHASSEAPSFTTTHPWDSPPSGAKRSVRVHLKFLLRSISGLTEAESFFHRPPQIAIGP